MRSFFILVFTFVLALQAFDSVARQDTELNSGWHFKVGDVRGAESVDFDESGWQAVSIPHNWGWAQAQEGKDFYRGPGWYRRELDIEPEPGKRYFLRFEAASLFADVYVNGDFLGEHRGGFGAFCYEITKSLNEHGTNVIAVRVSNSWEPDIAPLSGDFSVYGGIYRPVHLIETAAEDFSLTDRGSFGVAWLQKDVTKRRATIDVTTEISNGTKEKQSLTLVATVRDANGKKVIETSQPVILAPETTAPYWLTLEVPHPHLWNGRQDPYLYRAIVELRSSNTVLDSVLQSIGLRFYRVDPDKGFFLNGKAYPLHGVCMHQDWYNKGWALSHGDMDENLRLIKEIGATVVRCAHYQHSDYFYSLCDQAGILVWAEIPQVNEINASTRFAETSRGQLLDLIRQNINHPSIFAWSLFNEIGNAKTPDPERELEDLNNLAHAEDPTRPTIGATCTDKFPQMNKIPDWLGWNFYPGWYSGWGSLTNFGALLDKHRYDSQHGGFCVSEYGAGANVNQHEDNPAQPRAGGEWHPEEWQSIVHEKDWAALNSRPYIWATFVWNMFDFAVSTRREGGVPGRNDKGLVTYDRQTKKDAFYFYKANWSAEPVLYIADRRFTERTNAVTNVRVYSNARKVELLVDGKSMGTHRSSGGSVFIWRNVKLKSGENVIAAAADEYGKKLRDNCSWTLK